MVDRGLAAFERTAGRDEDYATWRQKHLDTVVPCEWVESTHPSYTLYTSGTTGKPKGCLLYTSPSPRDRTRYRMPSSA